MVEVGGRKLQRVRKKQNTGNGVLYACAILYHCSLKVVYLATFLLVFRVIRYTGTCKKLFYCIWQINLDMDIIKVFKGCRNVEKVGREGGLLAFQGKLIRCLSKLSKCWRGIAPTTLSSVDPMTKVLLYYL